MPALRTRDTVSRTLEVTTDAPQPPTLAIISPTPRTFNFPLSHNLSDSPSSSPCSSPFEPDLHPLALCSPRCTTPPHSLIRNLSPTTSLTSSSPSPSSHKRRKSSSSDVERRPKKGDEDYIKRPENAFILYRRKCCEDRQQAHGAATAVTDGTPKKQRQADLSKSISLQWKSLPAEERQYWETLAKEKKKEHEQMYPNYVYRPQRAKDKDGRSKNAKKGSLSRVRRSGEEYEQDEHESVSFVLPMGQPRHHGRSASAPTPPLPYQNIQIPVVYHTPGSCPTSPSLLPMISRRSAHPGSPEEIMSNFDYLPPNDGLMPSSFGQSSFEANLQSSEFLRMFSMQPHRLDTKNTSGLLPSHQILSPASSIASGSSGPSSPRSGPFTPTSASSMLSQPYSPVSPLSVDSPMQHLSMQCSSNGEPLSQAELDLHVEMQLRQDMEYNPMAYSVSGDAYINSLNWDSTAIWPPGSEGMLLVDDFDLSAIPPAVPEGGKFPGVSDDGELEMHMDGGDYSQMQGMPTDGQHHQQYSDEQQQGLLGFDEMIAGHSF